MSADYDSAPGPDAPEHNPEALTPDERNEMVRLEKKGDTGLLTPAERDHFNYLSRRDAQDRAAKDAAAGKGGHPLLDALPKTPEDLAKTTPPDAVALNRAQSAAYQGLMASGAVQPQEVIDHKAKLAELGKDRGTTDDVAAHKAANRTSGRDENDGVEKNAYGTEVLKAPGAVQPNLAPEPSQSAPIADNWDVPPPDQQNANPAAPPSADVQTGTGTGEPTVTPA